ncbi:ubiquitin carboxyl-terminal hydrolase 5 [Arthroderma uncinatum]|uniref:ubiquitin carboxyl-terminal hydrolase 5 n=1 Tax=Arthroderma uncinatum TaxID=74035 RepID=UPI00144A70F6|nr:ubiquitin carboxyl-terminal hydrolase 5 [Arthroderma uncinatum]KAF3491353.1 ubiquitin carboxyl-terminal hydrolase 5 [Arthroderma uncinatum]
MLKHGTTIDATMMAELLPLGEGLETLEETHNTWSIQDWGNLQKKELGRAFQCGGGSWQILLYPEGNGVDKVSIYFQLVHDPIKELKNWHACVQFALVLWDPKSPSKYVSHAAAHRFNTDEPDWGFTRFCERKKESKSLEGDNSPFSDKAWALQHVFSALQTASSAVSPTKLTDSFGWRALQLFEPQDAQEFLTVLLDSIAERLKVTPCRDAFRSLFTVEIKTNHSCVKVACRWSKEEESRHIRLNVRNNRTLMDSFNEYTSVGLLKGFMTGDVLKEQDVTRHISFDHLPSVLFLYLNRVEYDVKADAIRKLTDYHEFPEEMDMSQYLSDKADKSKPWDYLLFGVVVHASSGTSGNYYTFIRPKPSGQFYKFYDDRVTPATLKQAMSDNFGVPNAKPQISTKGLEPYYATDKYTDKTATMLIYIRKSEAHSILEDVLESDIPEKTRPLPYALQRPAHLTVSYDSKPTKEGTAAIDAQGKELKAAQESAASYMSVKFCSNKDFLSHHGFDLMPKFPEGYKSAIPLSYSRISESMVVKTLMTTISNDLGITGKAIRIWPLIARQNGTIRPTGPPLDPEMTMGDARKLHYPRLPSVIQLWIESEECLYGKKDSQGSSLVFLKHFDAVNQMITGFGHVYVTPDDTPNHLSPTIRKAMGWGSDAVISYVEEIKPTLIENMDGEKTMKRLEIGDGDVICFQRSLNLTEYGSLPLCYSSLTSF